MDDKVVTTKKELKERAQEIKLEEKQRKLEEKYEIKLEKERRKNSLGSKIRSFFLTLILVVILLCIGFYFGNDFLSKKEVELNNKKMSQTYNQALKEIEDKEYKKALELLRSIDENYDKIDEVKSKLKELEQLYLNEYLSKADENMKNKKYEQALEIFDDIDEEYKKSELVQNKKEEIYIAKLNDEVSELITDSTEKLEIIKFITEFEPNFVGDNLSAEKKKLIDIQKNELVLEARTNLTTDYQTARKIINGLNAIIPDDKDVKALVEELAAVPSATISLLDLEIKTTRGNLTLSDGTTIKSFNGKTEFTDYILKPATEDAKKNKNPYRIEIELGKKYKSLKGILCTLDGETTVDTGNTPKITMYNGSKTIYQSENFYDTSFEMDLTGVEKLVIEFEGSTTKGYFLANPELVPLDLE